MDKVYDPIRNVWLTALPEEIVRQNLLKRMVEKLGFPKSFLAVEKELEKLPHIKTSFSTDRRADIICFAKNIHPFHSLFPLLMIECKAVKLTDKVIEQVLGYNRMVQALFVCIANQNQVKTLWKDPEKENYEVVDFLPSYQELLSAVKKI